MRWSQTCDTITAMKPKPFWVVRVLRAVGAPLAQRLERPEFVEEERARAQRESDWDYAQADLQSWDDEPDSEGLSEALALCGAEPGRGFTRLHMLAEEGSAAAMNAIGERYYWGTIVPQDTSEGEA